MTAITWAQLIVLAIAAGIIIAILTLGTAALIAALREIRSPSLTPADVEDAIAGCIRITREAAGGLR